MQVCRMRWPRTRETWIVALILAQVLVWAGRYFVSPDSISYLDLSDDVRAGRFGNAVNAHWSPAYPYLLAVWLAPFDPGSRWEPIAVHILNGLIFVAAMATFEFFLRELAKVQIAGTKWLALPLDSLSGRFSAYTVFLWGALVLITVRGVTPDMLLAAIAFASAGVFTRIQSGAATSRAYAVLGLLLGAAALTKSFMFPGAVLMLGLSLIANARAGRARKLHLLSAAVFALVTAPQVITLSSMRGEPTFGDSARLVYALKVNQIPKLSSEPPVVLVNRNPAALSFPTGKANRTYPLWDEPSYWLSGVRARFDASDQAAAFQRNFITLAGIALKILIPLLIVMGLRDSNLPVNNRILAAVSGLVLLGYTLLHVEARLIGGWLVLLTVSLLAGITLDNRGIRCSLGRSFVHVITIVAVISTVTYVIDQSFSRRIDRGLNARFVNFDVARSLSAAGITRGEMVALVGDESDLYWARLAGLKVFAQIPLRDAPVYWDMQEAQRDTLNARLAEAGASALVASWTHPPPNVRGWKRVDGTEFSFLTLTR